MTDIKPSLERSTQICILGSALPESPEGLFGSGDPWVISWKITGWKFCIWFWISVHFFGLFSIFSRFWYNCVRGLIGVLIFMWLGPTDGRNVGGNYRTSGISTGVHIGGPGNGNTLVGMSIYPPNGILYPEVCLYAWGPNDSMPPWPLPGEQSELLIFKTL